MKRCSFATLMMTVAASCVTIGNKLSFGTHTFNGYLIGFIMVRVGVTGVLIFVTCASLLNMDSIAIFGPKTRELATEEIISRG